VPTQINADHTVAVQNGPAHAAGVIILLSCRKIRSSVFKGRVWGYGGNHMANGIAIIGMLQLC
jgi:hypothetical protein